jgi:hypothetical protein
MTPAELLADLRGRGFEVTAAGAWLRVRPASRLTSADRDAIRGRLPLLVALAVGVQACPRCSRTVDERRRCWHCCDRACEGCGRPTGSAFIANCLACDCGRTEADPGQPSSL